MCSGVNKDFLKLGTVLSLRTYLSAVIGNNLGNIYIFVLGFYQKEETGMWYSQQQDLGTVMTFACLLIFSVL